MAGVQRALALPLVSLLLLLSVVAAGCGGDDNASSAESWASDVCTELDTWATSVSTTIRNLMAKGTSVRGADLRAAANQASSATSDLVDGLKDIGPPDTDSGDEAQQQVNQLADQLRQHSDEVRSEVESAPSTITGLVSAGQAVLAQIGTAADQVKSTLTSLQQLGGDLRDGIEQSDACTDLRNKDFTGGS
jgi:ABC-type transporter Mla subunit MlaD